MTIMALVFAILALWGVGLTAWWANQAMKWRALYASLLTTHGDAAARPEMAANYQHKHQHKHQEKTHEPHPQGYA